MRWQGAEASRSRSGWLRAAALVALVACYLAIAWWPFDFVLPEYVDNGFRRGADGALVLDGSSWAYGPSAWVAEAAETEEFRVSLAVRAADPDQHGSVPIFTVANERGEQNLAIHQRGRALVVAIRRADWDGSGIPAFSVPGVFGDGRRSHSIAVDVSGGRLAIDVDTRPAMSGELGPLDWRSADMRVVFGTERSRRSGWDGEIREARVDVGSGRTDYLRTDLVVPDRRSVGRPTEFGWATSGTDVVVNVIGFVPLGFLLRRRPLLAIACGLALSLTMELGQLILPSREPSFADLITNTAGAALGALLPRGLAKSGYGPAVAGPANSTGRAPVE